MDVPLLAPRWKQCSPLGGGGGGFRLQKTTFCFDRGGGGNTGWKWSVEFLRRIPPPCPILDPIFSPAAGFWTPKNTVFGRFGKKFSKKIGLRPKTRGGGILPRNPTDLHGVRVIHPPSSKKLKIIEKQDFLKITVFWENCTLYPLMFESHLLQIINLIN